MRRLREVLRHGPLVLSLYVLVYWGRKLAFVLMASTAAVWIAGGPRTLYLGLNALPNGVCGFNLGRLVTELGIPPRSLSSSRLGRPE